MLKEKISKLIDLKSIITILLILTLIVLVITFAIRNGTLEEKLFLLFSNVTTMVITYFFQRNRMLKKQKKAQEYNYYMSVFLKA